MLILKKIAIKTFWFNLNLFLIPIGFIYLLIATKSLKLRKIRVFNFFQLDDGNLNFTAFYFDTEVFIKIDLFGSNLKNELDAYEYLENNKLGVSLTKVVFFTNKILITNYLRGSLTLDVFLKQNPHKYNWLVNKVNRVLGDFRKIGFYHNDFLLKNILIFKNSIYAIDFYFANYPGSHFSSSKKIAYDHTNSLEGDKNTFFDDLQTFGLYQRNYAFKYNDILSVIVVFEPNLENLKDLLLLHSSTFSSSVVVNNSPEINLGDLPKNIHLITCHGNIGLASGLNLGISYAKRMGFKMCALFDQDTAFSDSFAVGMIKKINEYTAKSNVAVFSPIFFNNVTGTYGYNIFFKFLFLIRSKPNPKKPIINPDYVITSGSFIPIESFDNIGLMLEKLFIDIVDIEWCFRAKRKNYSIISFQDIEVSHNMGAECFNFFGKNYPISSPLRVYYYFRNSFYLYHNERTPLSWKLVDFFRNIVRILFYLLLVDFRAYSKPIFIGITHGIFNKMGKSVL